MTASARLDELGIELPEVAKPLASYVPAVRSGNLVYTSGQLPMQAGKLAADRQGRRRCHPRAGQGTGADLRAQRAGRGGFAGGHRRGHPGGQGGRIRRVRTGIQRPAGRGQRRVAICSREVFGDHGAHARSAVGVAELPLDAPVEVELVVEVG